MSVRIRPVPPMEFKPRVGSRCRAAGCAEFTRAQKPYCFEHVLLHPYAAEVAARVEQREREERAGRLPVSGVIAEELLALLDLGPASSRWLARRLRVDRDQVHDLLRRLKCQGRVRERAGSRTSHWARKGDA